QPRDVCAGLALRWRGSESHSTHSTLMAPSTWPAMMPFDPESGEFPPALEALFARPPATVPAVLVVVGAAARRSGWAGRAAIAVATAWSERRPAITLADLTLSPSELASLLEVPEG